MRVFGIGAGRAGSVTFTLAMAKAGNYTTGHESHRGDFRAMSSLDYPDSHVEVDNRLSWFLPALGEKYPDDVLWVHLRRDLEMQAISYSKRHTWKGALVLAYGHGLMQRGREYTDEELPEVALAMVTNITANVEAFCRDKPSVDVWIEDPEPGFRHVWDMAHAQGDIEEALAQYQTKHNASSA